MLRKLCLLSICALAATSTVAQEIPSFGFDFGGIDDTKQEGISVAASLDMIDATTADLHVTVTLPSHHYIYSTTTAFGLPTKISIEDGYVVVSPPKADRQPEIADDPALGRMEKFYDKVTWTLRVKKQNGVFAPGSEVHGELNGQYCSGNSCLPIRPAAKFTAVVPADYQPPKSDQRVEPAAGKSSQATVTVVPKMRLPKSFTKPPIRFTVSLEPQQPAIGDLVTLSITAVIDPPFHTYSITQSRTEAGGLAPTEIELTRTTGLEPIDDRFQSTPAPEVKPNANGDGRMEIHHGTVTWSRRFTVVDEPSAVEGVVTFQICDERSCYPPAQAPFTVSTSSLQKPSAADPEIQNDQQALTAAADSGEFGADRKDEGLVAFLIAAVGAGFLALLTPCVYPMIPVTISYFLKQGENRTTGILKLAIVYCGTIVAAFTVIGLAVAVFYGPAALQDTANNKWLNLFFAAVFTAFALMLMGLFEISVPSWVLTWTSRKQESGGYLGVVFMALTFTLVSFTCTLAFVGQLLVVASQGSYLRPILGMAAFSAAFASPFFVLALFPSMLQKMPKSGGWMNRVKVTLGLAELAIVTKFLSVADTGFSSTGVPRFLDYHLVMASWIVVAFVTGFYLLNMFRTPHDSPSDAVGPVRCLFAMGFMSIGAYLLVALFSPEPPEGVLWQQVAAFAPPQFEITADEENGFVVEHDGLEYALDFDVAVKTASQANKPLFVDFTGVNCVNCRQMERVVLSQDKVHEVIEDLVRVQLYTDIVPGVPKNSPEYERLLKRNQQLQEEWVKTVTIPVYVIATPDGSEVLATYRGKDVTNGEEFRRFLEAGMKRWQQRQTSLQPQRTSQTTSRLAKASEAASSSSVPAEDGAIRQTHYNP